MTWHLLVVLHAVPTLFLAGLIWFVQIVHYPLFAAVGPERFPAYERGHCARTTVVVLPPMLAELGLAAWLWTAAPPHHRASATAGLLLVALIWLSTFAVQVPCHDRLQRGYDAAVGLRLVASNWLRTAAWTARAALAVQLLLPA